MPFVTQDIVDLTCFYFLQIMKDPKILISRLWVIFDVICFLLALWMTLKNIGRFHDDINATQITYKKYGDTVEDKYPSFSLCFEGDGLYHFNESAIFTAYGIHLNDYEMMLKGNQAFRYDYDPLTQRYNKSSLPSSFIPNVGFDAQDLFQLPKIFKSASFAALNQSESIFFGRKGRVSFQRSLEEPPLFVSYQGPKEFCLTRNKSYNLDFTRRYDYLTLDPSYLNANTRLKVYIHYPGHLLRSYDTTRLETLLSSVQADDVPQIFSVSQTTILRKRSVQNYRCNENIDDHDRFLLQSLSNDIGCVPPYWRNIIGSSSSLTECSSPEKLREIYEITMNYQKVLEYLEAPCLDMFSSAVWSKGEHDDSEICEKCIYLKIVYLDKYYEEIREVEDFGFEDFISDLGGFIGIFLGYSMMQIPFLLGISEFY